MLRQVVKELPEKATLIRPLDHKPVTYTIEFTEVMEGGETIQRERKVPVTWVLDSDVARLIGEAKSLPKGSALQLDEAVYISLYPKEVAWLARGNGVKLLQLRETYFLSKDGK